MCFGLVQILAGDQFPIELKQSAILVLFRNHESIRPELIPEFATFANPCFEAMIQSGDMLFVKCTAEIMTHFVRQYGSAIFPRFLEIVGSLFSRQETVPNALECVCDLAIANQPIPDQILGIIPQVLGSGLATYQTLVVIRHLTKRHLKFVTEVTMPMILSLSGAFEPLWLGQAVIIAIAVFREYQNPVIGDFIAHCIASDNNLIYDSAIAELTDDPLIEPYPPIILALMCRIRVEDDDFDTGDTCTAIQMHILPELAKYDPENVPGIIIGSLQSCVDPGHCMRCLYPILDVIPNSCEFIPMIESGFETPFRGNACSCAMSICFTTPDYTQRAIDLILPVLADENENVKSQAIHALTELVETPIEECPPQPAILEYLINATAAHQGEYQVRIAQLVNRYSARFYELEMTPTITQYLQMISAFFMESSPEHPLFNIFTETLGSLIELAKIPFQESIAAMVTRLGMLMMFDEPDLISVLSYLLAGIVRTCGDAITGVPCLREICTRLTALLTVEENPTMVEAVLEPVRELIERVPAVAAEFGDACVAIMVRLFSSTNTQLSVCIARILLKVFGVLSLEYKTELLDKCTYCVSLSGCVTDDHLPILTLGVQILQEFMTAGVTIDPMYAQLLEIHGQIFSQGGGESEE